MVVLSPHNNQEGLVKYSKGSILMVEGAPTDSLYLVKVGAFRVIKEDGHRLTPMFIVREKGFIGELSIFNEELRNMTAVALEDSEVYKIEKNDIQKVLNDCPEWVTSIMVTITDRLKSSMDMLAEHRIADDSDPQNGVLSVQEEKEIKLALESYREEKGLNS